MTRTKFNVSRDVEKRTFNNIVFDSKIEMEYYRDVLLPLVGSGDIIELKLQVSYVLQPKFKHNGIPVQSINYVADFYAKYKDGKEVVLDVKGCPDAVSKIKRKLFWFVYPDIDYRWVCKSLIDGGWCDYETVIKARKARKKKKKEDKEKKNG